MRRRSLPCTDAMSTDSRRLTMQDDKPDRLSSTGPAGTAKDVESMYASLVSYSFKTFSLSGRTTGTCAGDGDGAAAGALGRAPSLRLKPKRAFGATASRFACMSVSSAFRCYCRTSMSCIPQDTIG